LSLINILKSIQPRKFEPIFQRDLIRLLNQAKSLGQFKALDNAERIIRENIFFAFLGGKLKATREFKERHSYSMGDFDFITVRILREKYREDYKKILRDYFTQKEPDKNKFVLRIKALAQVATWDSYNKGKVSTYRQRAKGKLGSPKYFFGQEEVMRPRVYWLTAGDERVCPECMDLDGEEFDLFGNLPTIPLHVNCRCELMTVEVHRWR